MACINQPNEDLQRRALTPSICNEIVRDLVVQMYVYAVKPRRAFCTKAAEMLVKTYPFMRDTGTKISGYVSLLACMAWKHSLYYILFCG